MSHFLNPDSDKKKSALTSTFPELFFCAAATRAFPQRQSLGEATQSAGPPARDDCAASPKLFFLFGRAVPMLAHGVSWCCAAPPALAPATRKTREQSARERRARISFCVSVFSIRAARERGGFVFRERKKRSRGNTAPTGTLFAFGEKEDYFFFFPVDLKSFFTDATA